MNYVKVSYQVNCKLIKFQFIIYKLFIDFIKVKDKIYELWDFKPTFKSYITIESFLSEKDTNRILYFFNLDSKQNIRIGRSHDSDIRVTDISVSRYHALIRKENNGTLIFLITIQSLVHLY